MEQATYITKRGANCYMNANAFRHFYDYHFAENRKTWDRYVAQLPEEQFTQTVDYSHGSVRNQILHIIGVDSAWFGDLRSAEIPEPPDFEASASRETIRAHWDAVEEQMRAYLANVSDDMLETKPLSGEDANLLLWQVLLHVVNHGTDHRAQLLRSLNDLGVETEYQDYIFYVYGNS